MPITESDFDSEEELECWVKSNMSSFIKPSIQMDGFKISTLSGKGGIPDGFAFDFGEQQWFVIECELLKHGVWPHIAEQITRFVVALKNPDSRRVIRDRVFEAVLISDSLEQILVELSSTTDRLLQNIEIFIDGVEPRLLMFIDETNRDLQDMVAALDISSAIYRVKKLFVNGLPEYYSPDQLAPTNESEKSSAKDVHSTEFDVVELLGGGRLEAKKQRFRCYKLADGRIINIKRSKLYERNNVYWYGISPASLTLCDIHGVTHIAFTMDDAGVAVVPIEMVHEFIKGTKATHNHDGSVRHYHVFISNEEMPSMYYSSETPQFELSDYFHTFD